jgi:hypothetical protein
MTIDYYLSEFEKKFLEIKLELISNKDDLEETIKLLNELIRATNSYNQIKNIFWNVCTKFIQTSKIILIVRTFFLVL